MNEHDKVSVTHPAPAGDEPTLDEIQEERTLAKRVTSAISIDRLAIQDPDRVVRIMENRMKALESVRLGAIRQTEPHDWTLNQDKERHVIATLRKSGCVKVRKYFGISTINIRPPEVRITTDPDGKRVAEIWGDGICALTGELIIGVRGARSSSEDFTGRGNVSDLKEAARTNLENKIARILAGMTAVSFEELKTAWDGTGKTGERCYKGHGYGSSAERGDTNGASLEQLKTLVAAIVQATKQAEQSILMEATVFRGKDGKNRWAKSWEDLTQDWQISRALERLQKKYPNVSATAPGAASVEAPTEEAVTR